MYVYFWLCVDRCSLFVVRCVFVVCHVLCFDCCYALLFVVASCLCYGVCRLCVRVVVRGSLLVVISL